MDVFLATCGPWVSCDAIHIPSKEKFILSIFLQENSLKFPVMTFESQRDHRKLLFPINRLIFVNFNETKILFTFSEHEDVNVLFEVSDSLKLELFVSQFRVCATISTLIINEFQDIDIPLLQQLITPQTFIDPLSLIDLFKTQCTTLPITLDHVACKTWKNRVKLLNRQQFTAPTYVSLSVLTWNVGSGKPNKKNAMTEFQSILNLHSYMNLIVLEEVEMTLSSSISGSSKSSSKWRKIIEKVISQNKNLVIAADQDLGSVYALLIIDKQAMDEIPIIFNAVQSLRLGFSGLAANKSAIFFFLKVGEARITLAGCHLTPHTENFASRNEQLHLLLQKGLEHSDYFILAGDLNYRIELDYDDCLFKIASKDIKTLLQHDQLTKFRTSDPLISKYLESDITFPPTYKFDKKSTRYDTSPKKRVPSYTDRVLVAPADPNFAFSNDGHELSLAEQRELASSLTFVSETDIVFEMALNPLQLLTEKSFGEFNEGRKFPSSPEFVQYTCHDNQFSDHRPVVCQMNIEVPIKDISRYSKFKVFMMQKLNDLEDLMKPKLEITPNEVEFNFEECNEKIIEIKNISGVWAKFQVLFDSDNIEVSPQKGIIYPGIDMSFTITAKGKTDGPVLVSLSNNDISHGFFTVSVK